MEGGGIVLELDLVRPENGWRDILRAPVTGMAMDRTGKLWICWGGMGAERGLYSYSYGDVTEIIGGSYKTNDPGTITFSGEETDIMGISVTKAGLLYLLAGRLGVFAYQDGKLMPVLNCDFYSISKGSIGCAPNGLVVDAKSNLFVHSNGFGVFCFLKRRNGYKLEQLVLPGNSPREPNRPALMSKMLGDAKVRAKDYEGAISAYTTAISQGSDYSEAYEARAAAEEALGKIDEARKDREAVQRIEDDSAE
jgi:hypothetical protein